MLSVGFDRLTSTGRKQLFIKVQTSQTWEINSKIEHLRTSIYYSLRRRERALVVAAVMSVSTNRETFLSCFTPVLRISCGGIERQTSYRSLDRVKPGLETPV
ncbi:hypothetical protein PoB_002103000 [Plakobranchus ocellatus]|uniref:Uncharacterized protein n=1 Tax=Plakobranchus ocellatus TaxID=259542 RepID=A0AAV3ZIY8_9GAST|nr:hypothetical protein PoB_002103000 [Plakobranchus ocellatus]